MSKYVRKSIHLDLSVIDGEVILLLVEAGEVDRLHVVDVDQVGNGSSLIQELVEHDLWLGDRPTWMTIVKSDGGLKNDDLG